MAEGTAWNGVVTANSVRRGTLLATQAAFWAAAFLLPYREASRRADATSVALVLLAASAVFSSGAAIVELRGRVRLDRTNITTAIALAVLSVVGNICSARSLLSLEPAVASVLLRTQILFVAAAGAVLLGERISGIFAIGAAASFVGLLVMRIPTSGSLWSAPLGGIGWALGASLCFSAMAVLTRRTIHLIHPVSVNALRLWLAVAILALVPGAVGGVVEAGASMWLFATAAAFCGPFLSRLCIMFSLRHITAAYQTLVSLSSPVFAFVLAYLLVGSVPTAQELSGGAVMLAGILVVVASALRQQSK